MNTRRRSILVGFTILATIVLALLPWPIYYFHAKPAREKYELKKQEPNPIYEISTAANERWLKIGDERRIAERTGRLEDARSLAILEKQAEAEHEKLWAQRRAVMNAIRDNEGEAAQSATQILWIVDFICAIGLMTLLTASITVLFRGGLLWGALTGFVVGLVVGATFGNIWISLSTVWKITLYAGIVFALEASVLGVLIGLVCGFFTRKRKPAA